MFEHFFSRFRRPRVTAYHNEELPEPLTLRDAGDLSQCRLVVIDLETSGLNVSRDRILAIGALAIEQSRIHLADQFDALFLQPTEKAGETILIHGLGPQALAQGVTPEEGLMEFLRWSDRCVYAAFHAPFDHGMLQRAYRHHLGLDRHEVWLDLADVLPALFPSAEAGEGRLDDWLEVFHLNASDRHNAAADAMVTAELLLIAIGEARRQGIHTVAELAQKTRLARRLRSHRSHM